MSEDAFFSEIQDSFLQEASDLLGKVEALSLTLEKNPDNPDTFAELARLAHNFKGSGKAVGFDHISSLGHRLEDFILAIRNRIVPSTPDQIDFLFKCLDQLKLDVESLIVDKSMPLDHSSIFAEIDARLSGRTEIPTQKAENLKSIPVAAAASEKKVMPSEVLRIQKQKIDFLLEAFGEQVILQSTLEQCKFNIESQKDLLLKTISQLTKLTFELQSHALSLTMVQLGPTFTKLERATRDAARVCHKEVEIAIEGADIEVDKSLIDQLSDSLTHMVRNSVDHAIEMSDQRIQINKPQNGKVTIRARRMGGQLWIEVQDDGKGLDPKILKAKALSKGLISSSEADRLSDEQAYQLIFKNGFSTKENVSEVSGRGVGMNVVSETVNSLKGVIEIESQVNQGTLFRLKLPLSLAIFSGAVVRVNDLKYVVPNSEIAEIARVNFKQRTQVSENEFVIQIRGEVFRLVDLRQKLKGIGFKGTRAESLLTPVLISRKFGNFALLVDEIIGMQKIVQKPLGDEVKSKAEFAAGTILSDGSPGVILNLHFFCQSA